jgi:glucose/arabinose dehydrogenase
MKPVWRVLPCALWLAAMACGGSDSAPAPGPSPGPGGGDTINGTERLGWNQAAANAVELATFRYAIYVDGTRSEIADASCSPAGDAFACSGRLPALSAGSHVIEVATFVLDGSSVIESPRSAPLTVTVRGVTSGGAGTSTTAPSTLTTADGLRLAVETVADGFEKPVDVAVASDGRLFVAQQDGRIRILEPGRAEASLAIQLDDVLVAGQAGGLLAIALDPEFDRTGFVFALYTTAGRQDESAFRLARLRESGGSLAERAILLDGIPASLERPAASIRFGPDGKMYVALDDGGRPDDAARLSSYNGKVLRLNRDGTTPDDQPAFSPVHATGLHSPGGLDWHPIGGSLWVVDRRVGDPRVTGFGRSDRHVGMRPASIVRIPADSLTGGARFYGSASITAFEGDLFVAGGDALLRLGLGQRNRRAPITIERLLEGPADSVRALAVGADGSIYVASAASLLRLRQE